MARDLSFLDWQGHCASYPSSMTVPYRCPELLLQYPWESPVYYWLKQEANGKVSSLVQVLNGICSVIGWMGTWQPENCACADFHSGGCSSQKDLHLPFPTHTPRKHDFT